MKEEEVLAAIATCNDRREANRREMIDYFFDIKDWLCDKWINCTNWTDIEIDFALG